MVQFLIRGIQVSFPYEPYACQKIYMENVMDCLINSGHGMLESPTGTGKTLCLLCASLGWVMHQKVTLKHKMTQLDHRLQMGADGTVNDDVVGHEGISSLQPRVFYSSRTHSQLAQVVRELNKTEYKDVVKTCVMGSRDQLCLNHIVKMEPNHTLKNHICRHQVKTRRCAHFNGYDKLSKANTDMFGMSGLAEDIEDMLKHGQNNCVCPYYRTRDMAEQADLILLPYNYILEKTVRSANKISLRNSIVIFDEAHNLEKICEASCSVSIRSRDIAACVREAKTALNMILDGEEKIRGEMDASTSSFAQSASAFKNAAPQANASQAANVDISPNDLAMLTMALEKVQASLDEIDVTNMRSANQDGAIKIAKLPGKVYAPEYLTKLLAQCDISPSMAEPIANICDKTAAYLAQQNQESELSAKGTHLSLFGQFLSTVFMLTTEAGNPNQRQQIIDDSKSFLVYITNEQAMPNKFGGSGKPQEGLVLSYMCFNAGIGMRFLLAQDHLARSIIITSGTLSPMNLFANEIGIPFHLRLQNDHVIGSEQVLLGVVTKGPGGERLDGSFENRSRPEYTRAMGSLLLNVLRMVPEGVLLFFASYTQMNICIEAWKASSIWDSLTRHKPVLVEPKDKREFRDVMNQFEEHSREGASGALLMAVCRGKVSEGIDFSDRQARLVIICGIPYPPLFDAGVCLKRYHITHSMKTTHSNVAVCPSDSDWYKLEAVRAVNQAIGRVIRHSRDYGAVLLADSRYERWSRLEYPRWMQSSLNVFNGGFGLLAGGLAKFYKLHRGVAYQAQGTTANVSVTPMGNAFTMKSNNTNAQTVSEAKRDLYNKQMKQNETSKQPIVENPIVFTKFGTGGDPDDYPKDELKRAKTRWQSYQGIKHVLTQPAFAKTSAALNMLEAEDQYVSLLTATKCTEPQTRTSCASTDNCCQAQSSSSTKNWPDCEIIETKKTESSSSNLLKTNQNQKSAWSEPREQKLDLNAKVIEIDSETKRQPTRKKIKLVSNVPKSVSMPARNEVLSAVNQTMSKSPVKSSKPAPTVTIHSNAAPKRAPGPPNPNTNLVRLTKEKEEQAIQFKRMLSTCGSKEDVASFSKAVASYQTSRDLQTFVLTLSDLICHNNKLIEVVKAFQPYCLSQHRAEYVTFLQQFTQ